MEQTPPVMLPSMPVHQHVHHHMYHYDPHQRPSQRMHHLHISFHPHMVRFFFLLSSIYCFDVVFNLLRFTYTCSKDLEHMI